MTLARYIVWQLVLMFVIVGGVFLSNPNYWAGRMWLVENFYKHSFQYQRYDESRREWVLFYGKIIFNYEVVKKLGPEAQVRVESYRVWEQEYLEVIYSCLDGDNERVTKFWRSKVAWKTWEMEYLDGEDELYCPDKEAFRTKREHDNRWTQVIR